VTTPKNQGPTEPDASDRVARRAERLQRLEELANLAQAARQQDAGTRPLPPPEVSNAPEPLERLKSSGPFKSKPKPGPDVMAFDIAHLKPYLDYSHWTLMESAYLLCRQIPRSQPDFIAHEMNAGGPVGHMYRRLKDATLPDAPNKLACIHSPQWSGFSRVRKAIAVSWALAERITLPPELAEIPLEATTPPIAAKDVGPLAWEERARARAVEILKRQHARDLFPSQIEIADEIAREFRGAGVFGKGGKPLTGAYIKRHALKGISSEREKLVSTKRHQGK
jgi:hypothetical protein